MATYAQIFDMANDPTLNKQVTVACRSAARDILNEASSAPDHVNRARWANGVLGGNGALLVRMLGAVTQNATLQAAAPSGPWLDSDIQFTVNSLVNAQADNP